MTGLTPLGFSPLHFGDILVYQGLSIDEDLVLQCQEAIAREDYNTAINRHNRISAYHAEKDPLLDVICDKITSKEIPEGLQIAAALTDARLRNFFLMSICEEFVHKTRSEDVLVFIKEKIPNLFASDTVIKEMQRLLLDALAQVLTTDY